MTTIKDVARVAGVSFKTVSRVINGETNVRPAMRERIETAIRELNYRPTLAARQLASHKSFIVTLVIPRFVASYIARMMIAMAAQCRAVGYHLVTELYEIERDAAGNEVFPQFSVQSDAIILMPPFSDHLPLLEHVASLGTPMVRVAGILEGYGTRIEVDDTEISAELVRHLIGLGHRRIGMIAPPLPVKASETRIAGFMAALEEAGLDFDPKLLVRGDFSFGSGVRAAKHLLALPERPTAIFAASDEMALGVLAVARQLGYAVPGDLAIAGFDDSPESRLVSPPLTTIFQPIADIAGAAVYAATGRGKAPGKLSYRVVLRGSTTGSDELCLEPYGF